MTEKISYRFFAAHDEKIFVDLNFDPASYRIVIDPAVDLPEWTRLGFERCPNCNLDDAEERCPAAVALAQYLPKFSTKVSYEKAVVEVETRHRTVVSKTTFQQGMAALMGLTLASSGCPRTRFLRPMARAHLPFATDEETVFRILAFYLLAQYVAAGGSGSGSVPLSLAELKDLYREVSTVNSALAERLRAAISRDAVVNAVIILDSFALIAPENIDSGFEDIRSFFAVEDSEPRSK